MTIKQLGGVFGRNPTFNNVTIEGTLTFDGDIDINSDLTIEDNLYVLGSVGIGTTTPSAKLHVKDNTTVIGNDASGYAAINFHSATTGSARYGSIRKNYDSPYDMRIRASNSTGSVPLIFEVSSSSEAMRIDTSRNLLVGKTVLGTSVVGVEARANGLLLASRSGGEPLILDRKTSDGSIVDLRKDGQPVGSIGVKQSDAATGDGELFVASGQTGLFFDDVENYIRPCNASGALRDAFVDLGASNSRFKDLYLSNGVVFGTTGGSVSSKTLDDYEEGTWTPTVSGDATGVIESPTVGGYYTKVGNQVTLYFNFRVTTNFTDSFVGGLPFQVDYGSMSSSWVTGGVVLGGASNTVSAGLQNGTSVLRLFNNTNFFDTHEPNTTMEYYRLQLSYRTDS